MPSSADYLNLSEHSRLAEIGHDIAELMSRAKLLRKERARIKARGIHRMECARVATGGRK